MDAKKRIQSGWIHILITFELIGTPKEHIDKTLKAYLEVIKKRDDVHWVEDHIGEAEKNDQNYFSAYAEVDMLVKNLDALVGICIEYTPASVEILEPNKFEYKALDMQNWVNDILSKLHGLGMAHKQQVAQYEVLKTQFQMLINNIILLSLARSPKKILELSKDTSLKDEALKGVVKKLLENKLIVERKGVYSLK